MCTEMPTEICAGVEAGIVKIAKANRKRQKYFDVRNMSFPLALSLRECYLGRQVVQDSGYLASRAACTIKLPVVKKVAPPPHLFSCGTPSRPPILILPPLLIDIPTQAARFSPMRRIMACRATQRGLCAPYASPGSRDLLYSCHFVATTLSPWSLIILRMCSAGAVVPPIHDAPHYTIY